MIFEIWMIITGVCIVYSAIKLNSIDHSLKELMYTRRKNQNNIIKKQVEGEQK